ncbi:MAG: hypothetical protein FJZ97_13895, partial [Chloroflexi bacterium]|nr:hypothetical protein [Chloroflexota bacterium]
LDEELLCRIRAARAAARERAWKLGDAPRRIILDIDATLLTAHSDKEGAAGNYKGGFGFHPLLCVEATTGEALAGILRPGNAGANSAADHVAVLKPALAQLPEGAAGPGTLVRCDSAGATHAFLDEVVARGLRGQVIENSGLTDRFRRNAHPASPGMHSLKHPCVSEEACGERSDVDVHLARRGSAQRRGVGLREPTPRS